MGKPKISDALRESLEARGLSIRAAARQAEVNYESVKSWLARNKFPRHALPRIARIAGIDPADAIALEEKYDFDWARPKNTSQSSSKRAAAEREGVSIELSNAPIDSRLSRIKRLGQDPVRELNVQLKALREHDIYVHCSLELPPTEAQPLNMSRLSSTLAAAIDRGASFFYIVPSARALRTKELQGIGLLPSAQSVRSRLNGLIDEVKKEVGSTRRVKERLRIILCHDHPFFVPRHRYVLFRYENPERGHNSTRCFGHFPAGHHSEYVDLKLSMDDDFTSQFWEASKQLIGKQLRPES